MGIAESYLREHANAALADCLAWPFSTYRNGYGQAWFEGQLRPAHRVMATLAHGEPPTPKHQAAHSCGNRRCVNPSHLRWLTQSENELDKRAHGTAQQGERNGAAKLTAREVAQIKALLPSLPDSVLGPKYGVDRKTISAIRRGRTWRAVKAAA